MSRNYFFRGRKIVKRSDENRSFDPWRAGARRVCLWEIRQTSCDQTRDTDGMLTVISAFELQHFWPACGGLRHAKAKHRRFGSRGDKADALDAGADERDAFGEFDRFRIDAGKINAALGLSSGGF